MNWRVGDRLVVAPTTFHSTGTADAATIASIADNVVHLSAPLAAAYMSEARSAGSGKTVLLSAEVINLSRNVLITGDDLSLHDPCDVPTVRRPGLIQCTHRPLCSVLRAH
jgi:hypothetical protein